MATATQVIDAPGVPHAERWTPSLQGWIARTVVLVAIFGGILFLTLTVDETWANHISYAAIFAIIGLSLNIILGYVGQVSLGHQGFVGLGAFVAAYFATEKAGCAEVCSIPNFATALIVAGVSGIIASGILGLVALRIRGLYLALITLAFGVMATNSIFEISFLTRGGGGMPAPRPRGFVGDNAYALLTLAFLAALLFVDWSLVRSKVGRAILSLKHSEPVAASYGVNVTAYKILAFMVSGLFAGLGGALFAFRNLIVVANDFFFEFALLWVLMVVVGGLGNRTGVVIGSSFFALFAPIVREFGPVPRFLEGSGRALEDYVLTFGALLAILTIVKFPGGIAEQISPITRWLRGERFSVHPEGHGRAKPTEPKQAVLGRLGLERPTASPGAELPKKGLLAALGLNSDPAPQSQPSQAPTEPSPASDGRAGDSLLATLKLDSASLERERAKERE